MLKYHKSSSTKFEIGVSIVMEKNGRILFLKRATNIWLGGFYSLPAGKLEKNETLFDAAIRELKEEIGIKAKKKELDLIHTLHCITPTKEWFNFIFKLSFWKGTPLIKEPDKHSEISWLSSTSTSKNIAPHIKHFLKCYNQNIFYLQYKE